MSNTSFELSYATTEHDVSFQGARGTARYNAISMDFKRHFFVQSPLQPHLLLGWVPYSWCNVKDGSATRRGKVGDATFVAPLTGLNVGAGLTVYPHPRIFLGGTAIYRLVWFGTVKGAEDEFGDLEESLNGNGITYVVEAGFTF